jgi:signal transduction histidine kinase
VEERSQIPARILIVDDEPGIREGCQRVLTARQFTAETAANITSALAMIGQAAYDLALIDVVMPDGNGLDLIRAMHERDPDTICIVITGYATVEMAVQAVKQGAYDFISKPFSSEQLLLAVNQGLERRRLYRQTAELEACQRRADMLQKAKIEIEKLEQIKSHFMLTVAHEMRAPVAAVQSYLNLILAGYVSEADLKPTLSRAQRRLQEVLDLVADLLELARLKQAQEVPSPSTGPQPMANSLEEVVEALHDQATQKQQRLEVSILARPTIEASPNHLRLIWMNLISNAIKYTPRGGAISVKLDADQIWLTGVVQDTGIGVGERDLPHLFQEFFRTDQAKASGEIGTGLGLAIVKQVIDSYHGHITVTSRLGAGTCFTFVLPLRPAQASVGPLEVGLARPTPPATHAQVLGLSDDPHAG